MSTKIIAVGNPGVGKSSFLNSLAGENLFKSGLSIGRGLTYQLDEQVNARGHFLDTPGIFITIFTFNSVCPCGIFVLAAIVALNFISWLHYIHS